MKALINNAFKVENCSVTSLGSSIVFHTGTIEVKQQKHKLAITLIEKENEKLRIQQIGTGVDETAIRKK